MIVVADTSPLNYLIRLGRSEILPRLYEQITIPHAVRDELLRPQAPFTVRRWASSPPPWVNVVSALRLDPSLPKGLGMGEIEAISLAMELVPSLVLIDDLPARLAAEERGLRVTGTLTVLLQAARKDLLVFSDTLDELKRLGFRFSESLEEKFRQLAAES